MSDVFIIRNPEAGRRATLGKHRKAVYLLRKVIPESNFYISRDREDFLKTAEKAVRDYEIIVVIGGDTSYKEVATLILQNGKENTLGMIPVSLGDIPSGLGITSIKKICSAVTARSRGDIEYEKKMDVGCLEYDGDSRYFLGSASFLVPLETQRYVEKKIKGSPTKARYRFIYGPAGIYRSFRRKVYEELTLEYDGISKKRKYSSVVFSNIPYLAKLKINPYANPFDGELDAYLIELKYSNDISNYVDFFITSLMTLVPMHTLRGNVDLQSSKEFKIHSGRRLEALIDGAYVGPATDFKAYVEPGALRVIVPKS